MDEKEKWKRRAEGEILRQLRIAKGWTQQTLSAKISDIPKVVNCSREQISRLETANDPDTRLTEQLRESFCRVYGISIEKFEEKVNRQISNNRERERLLTLEPSPSVVLDKEMIEINDQFISGQRETDSLKPWNVPQCNPFFTGRDKILNDLRAALTTTNAVALTQPQAISGLGGIGKTQTAVQYAYLYRTEYDAVLWTIASDCPTLIMGFVEMARLLNLPEKDEQNQSIIVEAVKRWLHIHPRWLLILDNADKPELIREFLPRDPKGHILLTSRAQVFDTLGIARPIELTEMTSEEAYAFLCKRTGRDGGTMLEAEKEAAATLAKELGYLPLALEQAGAYLTVMKSRFQDYLISYHSLRLSVLKRRNPQTGDYPASVATTWAMNFAEVEKASAASADILRASVYLSPDRIPLELFTESACELGPKVSAALARVKDDPLLLNEALEPLTRYSLIRRDIQFHTYDIHRLVQAVIYDEMNQEERNSWVRRAILFVRRKANNDTIHLIWAMRTVRAMNRVFPKPEPTNRQRCDRLLSHALVCADLIQQLEMEIFEAGQLLRKTAEYQRECGQHSDVERLYKLSLQILETVLGSEHAEVADSLAGLADLYINLTQSHAAVQMHTRSLSIRMKALRADHPLVADNLTKLALLYNDVQWNAEAEQFAQAAITIWEQAYGPSHLEVARGLHNLSTIYYRQRRYVEAGELCRRVLSIREAILEPYDLRIANTLGLLAQICSLQSRFEEAEPLALQALHIHERTYGPENHTAVLSSLNNLAVLYGLQRRFAQAEPLFQRAVEIMENESENANAFFPSVYGCYAVVLRQAGREAEAEAMETHATAIRRRLQCEEERS